MTRIDFNPSLIRYHKFIYDARGYDFACLIWIRKFALTCGAWWDLKMTPHE